MHDLTTLRFRNPAKNWIVFSIKRFIYIWVNRIVAHKSLRIITPSEYVREDVAKFTRINIRKIITTYEAAEKITSPTEPIIDLENESFIMYTGRPLPHKNLDRLIESYSILKKDNKSLKLVLAGKKSFLYRQIEKKVLARGLDGVIFPGYVSEGQLRWLYENTIAYIFPSLSEGFGLPGLEAMVHGAPVISSSYTCLPEIYGNAAEYFNPLDEEDMAKVINKVIKSSELRKKLIKKGFAQAKKYSWQKMAEETLAVYEDILGRD